MTEDERQKYIDQIRQLEPDYDINAPRHYAYYLLGVRPIRMTIKNKNPILAETIDFDSKTFGINNMFISAVGNSLDVEEIDLPTFREHCLKHGVKPPP